MVWDEAPLSGVGTDIKKYELEDRLAGCRSDTMSWASGIRFERSYGTAAPARLNAIDPGGTAPDARLHDYE
jgi:hypothetical protein